MKNLVCQAPSRFKLNYDSDSEMRNQYNHLFKLDPAEHEIVSGLRNIKRYLFNENDPFFKRRLFRRRVTNVLDTGKVL